MTDVVADISVSLDGYVTGPDPGPDNGLGDGGEALHTWAFSDDPDDRRIVSEATRLGGGTPLFVAGVPVGLRQTAVVSTSTATHLTYDVR